jgi:hypothetical protein
MGEDGGAAAAGCLRWRSPRRRWWMVAAPGALGAAVVAAVVVSLGSGVQEGRVALATAAAALERAAHAAEQRPTGELFPRPDQFFYTRSSTKYSWCREGSDTKTTCKLVPQRREIWLSESRPGRVRNLPVRAAERNQALDAPLPPERFRLGNETMSYAQVLAYDPAPAALFARLRDGVGRGQGPSLYGEVYTQIGDTLREQATPPRLRAALYRALKLVPGVRYVGAVKDRLGRPALAVARTEDGVRHELLFDPATSAMLAERDVVVAPGSHTGFKVGTVVGDAVYERQAVVARVGERR